MRRNKKNRANSIMRRFYALLGLTLSLLFIVYIDSRIRPIIKTVSSYQARQLVIKYINTAILETLENENINTSDVVKIRVGESGIVSSIQTDMVTINRLKADITSAISDELATLQSQTISIPLGNMLGIQFLSGRGPKISFEVIPSSFVQSTFTNSFKSAGINQTIHQLNIEIKTSVLAVVPGYTNTTEVMADFCVAETVIVGVVPEAFTQVITGENFEAGILNDFGAQSPH